MEWTRDLININDLMMLRKKNQIITQPYFQRSLVWAEHSKAHFIESILLGYPVPEIYVYKEKIGESESLAIVDGQQRISSLFSFLDDEICLDKIESEKFDGKQYSTLLETDKSKFLAYTFAFVIIDQDDKTQIIDMYKRINKYTVNLNDQEIRKAAYYDYDYLKIATMLSNHRFFEEGKLFTPKRRQRMIDIEYTSELMCILMDGIQDKKNNLNDFYDSNIVMEDKCAFSRQFIYNLYFIEKIFSNILNFKVSRYRQLSDFYSLYAAVNDLSKADKDILLKKQETLYQYLALFDYLIEPESEVPILREYALKCVSQANTKNSRLFRYELINSVFKYLINEEKDDVYKQIIEDLNTTFEFINIQNGSNIQNVQTKIEEYYETFE